jgi:hypothetical protein
MMRFPTKRFSQLISDGLRSYATPHGPLSSRFRRWSGYPSIAAISINPENGAMGHQRKWSPGRCRWVEDGGQALPREPERRKIALLKRQM